MIYMIYIYDLFDILLACFLTWILFEIKLLQTGLKLPLFEKCSLLNVKERVEGLFLVLIRDLIVLKLLCKQNICFILYVTNKLFTFFYPFFIFQLFYPFKTVYRQFLKHRPSIQIVCI